MRNNVTYFFQSAIRISENGATEIGDLRNTFLEKALVTDQFDRFCGVLRVEYFFLIFD